ncbi:MAG: hypothetical protein KF835_02445 [Xanthobacteraceae bacterium]|nr:hypothetical protein [Xanthobacteraceae bacterium]
MKPAKDPVRALIKASVIVVVVVAAIIGLFVFGFHECQSGRLMWAC